MELLKGVLYSSPILLPTAYYYLHAADRVQVSGSNKTQLEFLKGLKILDEKYYPTPYLLFGIPQTIFGLLKRSPPDIAYDREIFQLEDGGKIGLDFKISQLEDESPLVILLPGLTSTSRTTYVRTLVVACQDAGASVVVMNNRGLAGVPLETPKVFCAAECSDFQQVMRYLHEKFPRKRKVVVGTSFGGCAVSQFLIKQPDLACKMINAVVLISFVWNVHRAADRTDAFFYKDLVGKPILSSLKQLLRKHKNVLQNVCDVDDILKRSTTVREFDHNFTAKQFGFLDGNHYYDEASMVDKCRRYPLPVYALGAADDPLQPGNELPIKEAAMAGSNLVLLTTTSGGHLGFLEGMFPSSRRGHFMERFLCEFLIHFQRQHQEPAQSLRSKM